MTTQIKLMSSDCCSNSLKLLQDNTCPANILAPSLSQ